MNLSQIRCFVTCAQTLNFTRTAEALYMTQPNVSKKILLLEEELGVKLLKRSHQAVSLTAQGKLLYNDFVEILNKMDSLIMKASNIHPAMEAHLHIGLHGSIDLNRIAPGIFTNFMIKFPNANLSIDTCSYKELRMGLLNRNFDLIITYSLEKYDRDTTGRFALSRSKPKLYYTSAFHSSAEKAPVLADFKNELFLMLEESESPWGREYNFSICHQHGFIPNKIKYVNNIASMIVCIEQGIGVAILGASYKIQESSLIHSLEITSKNELVGTDIIWLKNNQNVAVKVFENYLMQTF